jgi:oligopeptide transport system substrate-binding protein
MQKVLLPLLSLVLIVSLLVLYVPGSFMDIAEETPTTTATITGDSLHLYGTDPYTLDPAIAGESTSIEYIMHIFSGLVRLDDDMQPEPDLAADWSISDDGRVYTFELRSDAFFQDGSPVTAEDFKYSWERACNPATGSSTAAIYLDDIVGVDAVLAGESQQISGVEVIDQHTLQVTITEPRSYFLYKLAFPTAFVVDKDNVESGADWWYQPNGSGPFKLVEWSQGSQLVLTYNDYYDITSSFRGVQNIVYELWSGVPMNLYETGEIDVASVSTSYIDKVTDPAGDFYQELTVVPQMSLTYIGFNCARAPFDDADIRRAFAMAIDKDKIVSLVFQDTVIKADGILPLAMPGYNENLDGIEFDVEQALALIADSEYGSVDNLPEITITTGGYGGLISSALEAIVNEWRVNLGVEVTVRQLEPEQFFYNLMQEKDEMYYWGWVADYPHPQNFLEILFRSGVEYNIGEYSNPQVDALLEQAAAEMDTELSLELYQQAEQLLVDDAACIPLFIDQSYVLTKPYVLGYELSPLGFARLQEVSIVQ